MKAKIGITTNEVKRQIQLSKDYVQAILGAGGLPFLMPPIDEEETIAQFVEQLDGLLITGGDDLDPAWFGEEPHPRLGWVNPERDYFEWHLTRSFLARNKPILAICRGCQILNVAAGGDIYQDLDSQVSSPLIQHRQRAPKTHASHYVEVSPSSLLYRIVGKSRIKVNSFHHQAIRCLAPNFSVCAKASDGVIEAVASLKHRFVLGVQWHPEALARGGDGDAQQLFNAFIEAAQYKER